MDINVLDDGQILTILSYLIDDEFHGCDPETVQINEHDIFENKFPLSHIQMQKEMAVRREILRPARELYAYTLVCKKFRDVIANPDHENVLYSGMFKNLKTCFFLTSSGPNIEDDLDSGEIFNKLFEEHNQEMLKHENVPVRIQHCNHDASSGFWHGRTGEELYWKNNLYPSENVTYKTVIISDRDRAAYLRGLKNGEADLDLWDKTSHIIQDPRFDFYILKLEGTPKAAVRKYRELSFLHSFHQPLLLGQLL